MAGVVLLALVLLALNLTRLPLISHHQGYSAYLANASGLSGGETVQVRGVRVGKITAVVLVDDKVRIDFEVDDDVDLGEDTAARVKVLNPLGSQFLEPAARRTGDARRADPAGAHLRQPDPRRRDSAGSPARLDKTDIPQLAGGARHRHRDPQRDLGRLRRAGPHRPQRLRDQPRGRRRQDQRVRSPPAATSSRSSTRGATCSSTSSARETH
ncbi:MCE family protein [Nocardioides sp. W3-2-3]|uniref:MlaD family protein n=1 Tax=Nocardioides convexus TaxID=2712224 RepID=UPI00241869C1|nr:MlaD family protein [Nocardioides convexus]NHA00071.1 MCE family protein [Nocardioides convexus]